MSVVETDQGFAASGPDYRVQLKNFAGPLDLLLHLIKKEELDIHDIPIKPILDQYLTYLEVMRDLDLDDAGDFLVMAATLMVIKSRMLLPTEEVDLDEEIDPRYELVQQLLEYKRFKDSTRLLEERAAQAARRVGRPESARPEPMRREDRSLDEIGLFDLLEVFARLLESVGQDAGKKFRRVQVDDKPVRHYVQALSTRLERERSLLFSEIMAGGDRSVLIGYFLALLLLLKQEVVACAQDGEFGDIRILYRGGSPAQDVDMDLEDDFR
jgi:segregation and condensation protein A